MENKRVYPGSSSRKEMRYLWHKNRAADSVPMTTSRVDNFWRRTLLSTFTQFIPFVWFSKQIFPRLISIFLAPTQLWNMLIEIPIQRGSTGSYHKLQTIQESHRHLRLLGKILVTCFQKAFILSNTLLPMTVETQPNVHSKSSYLVSNFRNPKCLESGHYWTDGEEV